MQTYVGVFNLEALCTDAFHRRLALKSCQIHRENVNEIYLTSRNRHVIDILNGTCISVTQVERVLNIPYLFSLL